MPGAGIQRLRPRRLATSELAPAKQRRNRSNKPDPPCGNPGEALAVRCTLLLIGCLGSTNSTAPCFPPLHGRRQRRKKCACQYVAAAVGPDHHATHKPNGTGTSRPLDLRTCGHRRQLLPYALPREPCRRVRQLIAPPRSVRRSSSRRSFPKLPTRSLAS